MPHLNNNLDSGTDQIRQKMLSNLKYVDVMLTMFACAWPPPSHGPYKLSYELIHFNVLPGLQISILAPLMFCCFSCCCSYGDPGQKRCNCSCASNNLVADNFKSMTHRNSDSDTHISSYNPPPLAHSKSFSSPASSCLSTGVDSDTSIHGRILQSSRDS